MASKKRQRMIRDWTASDKMDQVTAEAERFFTRLCMKADDYGYYHANPKLLNSGLFPQKEDVTAAEIIKWRNECEKVGLIRLYQAEGKAHLQIIDFGQKKRRMYHEFPLPPGEKEDDDGQVTDNSRTGDGQVTAERELKENRSKKENVNSTMTVEGYFKELENSSHLEVIASNNGDTKAQVIAFIAIFKPKAELHYNDNFSGFLRHFKNSYAQHKKKLKPPEQEQQQTRTSVTFGKKKR